MERVLVDEAVEVVTEEARLIAWLDDVALTGEEFEALATTLEGCEIAEMSESLETRAKAANLDSVMGVNDHRNSPPLITEFPHPPRPLPEAA